MPLAVWQAWANLPEQKPQDPKPQNFRPPKKSLKPQRRILNPKSPKSSGLGLGFRASLGLRVYRYLDT